MAAYAATVAVGPMRAPVKLGGYPGVAVVSGTVNVTNYNSTHVALSGITALFKGDPIVTISANTDNGYGATWVVATNSIKCWKGDYNNATDGPLIELADDVDAGLVQFTAIGVV